MKRSLLDSFKSKLNLSKPNRIIRLGIDYGTSNSKIVFRDYGAPGGEKAYVVLRNGAFRVPSAVSVNSEGLSFGMNPQTSVRDPRTGWHESLKMRVAGEVKNDYGRYCFGPQLDLPRDFSAKDLAILTVWFLISEGCRAIQQHLRTDLKSIKLGMTLGMPMSFYEDDQLKCAFWNIARNAYALYRSRGLLERPTIRLQEARKLLDFASSTVDKEGPLSSDEERNWVRTEAEAALWWPFQSPQVSDGPYAQIDIGAGTTNYSIFRIVAQSRNGHWIKEGLAFFGARSAAV